MTQSFSAKTAAVAILVVSVCFGIFGCGSKEPSPQELLLRRDRERKMAQFEKPRTREQQLQTARRELERGNYSQVESITRILLVAHPEDFDVIFLAAEAQAARGDKLAATKTLASIPDDEPNHGKLALQQSADWLVEAGHTELAIDRLQRTLRYHGESNRARHELARLLNQLGRRIESAEHLRVLARSGDVSEKDLVSMTTFSLPFIDPAMKKPDMTGELTPGVLAVAKQMRIEGEFRKSLLLTEALNERFPESPQISAFLGRLYADHEDVASLLGWLTETPEGIDREPEYWFAFGSLCYLQERHQQAIRCFGEAVSRDDTDRFSYLGMARSLSLLGEDEAAERVMNRYELLEESARLSRQFGKTPGTIDQQDRMADILDQLRRPWEAIAWRSIAARTANAAESRFTELQEQRETLKRQTRTMPELWLTCGIDLSQRPLPESGEMRSIENLADQSPDSVANPPIRLLDVAANVGLEFQYVSGDDPTDTQFFLHQQTGGGIGVIDYDLDGWPDCYFTQSGGPPMDASASDPNQLFRNLAGESFENVTAASNTGDRGYGQGVAAADINQDGFPDLIVANIGPNWLYLNQGDGTFTQQQLSDVVSDQWTTSIACGDLSGDHLPEIVEVNYVDDPDVFQRACTTNNNLCNPSAYRPAHDRILTLLPDGRRETWDAGKEFRERHGHGFGAIVADIDGQPGNELFIANDTDRNHYWRAQADAASDDAGRTLVDVAELYGCASGMRGNHQGCMGVAHGDFDRNGRIDFHITNFGLQESDLYLQRSGGIFSNATFAMGTGEPTLQNVGWGTQAIDLDRDGWLDIAVMNGHVVDHSHRGIPFKMRPQLFRGRPDRFELVTKHPDTGNFWSTSTLGRMLTTIDWNRDGKPDLLANHLDVPVTLLENRTDIGHWVQLELIGTDSERDAIGAEIRLQAGSDQWTHWVFGGDGILCSNEPLVDFGVSTHQRVTEIQITWPSGQKQTFQDLAIDSRYLAIEGETELFVR